MDYGCNCGTGYGHSARGFLTKEEKIEMLKEYQEELENEAKGVKERIKELEKNN
ncbi:MAG TPA: DUF5320 domain-containing protein [archaeon]|nr:DUF5320 domain-containing protein [archaeon]